MITPEQLAAPGSEHAHQVAFFQWAAMFSGLADMDMLFAVPNGGERNLAVAANMKAEGVKKGVPDVVWPVPLGGFAGLWLELKRPAVEKHKLGGRSDDQVKWHKKLVLKHMAVVTCYGWVAMAHALEMYATDGTRFYAHWHANTREEPDGSLFVAGNNADGFRFR